MVLITEQDCWIEKILNVSILSCDGWDQQDESDFTFYNAHFLLPELKKFDGKDVDLTRNSDIQVWNDDDTEALFEGNVGQFKSFRDQLNKMYGGNQ